MHCARSPQTSPIIRQHLKPASMAPRWPISVTIGCSRRSFLSPIQQKPSLVYLLGRPRLIGPTATGYCSRRSPQGNTLFISKLYPMPAAVLSQSTLRTTSPSNDRTIEDRDTEHHE